jgi:hypothetical protein
MWLMCSNRCDFLTTREHGSEHGAITVTAESEGAGESPICDAKSYLYPPHCSVRTIQATERLQLHLTLGLERDERPNLLTLCSSEHPSRAGGRVWMMHAPDSSAT